MRTTFHAILVIELKKLTKCSQIIMTNTSHIFVTINSHIWQVAQNREPKNISGTRHWERMPADMTVVIFQNLTCPLRLGWWLKWLVVIRSFMPVFSHKTQSYFACFPNSECTDRGGPAVSYIQTGWVWGITSWRSSRLQGNYGSFWRNLFLEYTPIA